MIALWQLVPELSIMTNTNIIQLYKSGFIHMWIHHRNLPHEEYVVGWTFSQIVTGG